MGDVVMSAAGRGTTAVLVLLAVLLGGCELRADVEVTVDRDGAGSLSVLLDADEELAASAAGAGLEPFAAVEQAAADDEAWSAVTTGTSVELTTAFASPPVLAERSRALADDLDAAELRPLEPLGVEVADDTVSFTGAAGLVPSAAVGELGFDEAEARRLLGDAVDYRVTVSMPGEVLRTSGGAEVDGRTVSWAVPAGERVELVAVARRPPRVPWWIWLAAASAAAALALGGLVVARGRRGA